MVHGQIDCAGMDLGRLCSVHHEICPLKQFPRFFYLREPLPVFIPVPIVLITPEIHCTLHSEGGNPVAACDFSRAPSVHHLLIDAVQLHTKKGPAGPG